MYTEFCECFRRPKRDGERETEKLSERTTKNKKRRKKSTEEIIANTKFFFSSVLPLEIGQNSLNTSETVCCKQFAAQISNDLVLVYRIFVFKSIVFFFSRAVVCQFAIAFPIHRCIFGVKLFSLCWGRLASSVREFVIPCIRGDV